MTITQPALATSPQPRPAPTRRALPSKPAAQRAHCLIKNVTGELTVRIGAANRIGSVSPMAGRISMGARREITAAVVGRYRSAGRADKGRILDELCAVTGWHRKHAVRALAHVAISSEARRQRRPTYGAAIRDALVALWEASDRICGKRLKVMIPTLLPSLERHGRLKLDQADRALVLGVSAATIDRLLVETKIAAAGGKRRRAGFYSALRREVPIRTFNDWHDPPPGVCEVDMVAHGGTSVAGSFIQTLTMVDVANRMHAAGDARERPRRASHGVRTEPVSLAHSRRRLRQRQRVCERCRRALTSHAKEVTR